MIERISVVLPAPLRPTRLTMAPLAMCIEKPRNAGIDWIALSFIQRPDDLAEVKNIARGRAGVMAKIEKPQAVERLPAIIEQADALMVARGDLGVELPLEKVPGIQKQITRAARRAGKPVVVATQMLESMVNAPVPTRAEVSDVATAVFEGADAVMLSAESASGAYPVEAVATMDRIATEVERDPTQLVPPQQLPALLGAELLDRVLVVHASSSSLLPRLGGPRGSVAGPVGPRTGAERSAAR